MPRVPLRFLGFLAILANLSLAAPGSKAYRILVLGDSLTEGYGVVKEQAFPALLQDLLRNPRPPSSGGKAPAGATATTSGRAVEVVNGGSSGATSASGVRRLKWYAKSSPDLVVLALGSNDGLRGVKVEETRKNVEAAIEFCRGKGWKVVLAGLEVPPNYGPQYVEDFRRVYPDLAKKHQLPLLAFLLEGVAGEPEMNLADGIHPNEQGHARIAENLARFLAPMLPPAGT